MILIIDNYDSFVHNLARYLRQLGCPTMLVRNDRMGIQQIAELAPQAIVLSPGPCTPDQAGVSLELVREFVDTIPILGICLGHQTIVQALGGEIAVSHQPMHGRQSSLSHDSTRMFSKIPSPFLVGRYHSLIASKSQLPDYLTVTAYTDDYTVMAVEHRTRPVVGLQFHPESILTEYGYQLLANFLDIAGVAVANDRILPSELAGEMGCL